MSTLTALLVAFFASLGAPVQQCNGAVVYGTAFCATHRMASPPPPPPPEWIVVEQTGAPRQISNGL